VATKIAAKRAGFGTREVDNVDLITEPEAAAELALKASVKQTSDLVKVQLPSADTGVLLISSSLKLVWSFAIAAEGLL